MAVLVAGISQLYQGDLDLGRVVLEHVRAADLDDDVVLEDAHYGAVAFAQRLEELVPDGLILVGAEERGRPPGTVERRRIKDLAIETSDVQASIGDAVTGYVTIDLAITVPWGLGALPGRTVAIEMEPASTTTSESLSATATEALPAVVDLVVTEVRRMPLLELTDRLWATLDRKRLGPSPAVETVERLLLELQLLDDEGRWGETFALRDRLRETIARGETSEGMQHLDWGLWWGLIEELDRLQSVEASAAS